MKRSEVEHVLRAAAAITQEQSFVVVGSQAILFQFPHAPAELVASRELDFSAVADWARRRAAEAQAS
jgi:hypothetical protein